MQSIVGLAPDFSSAVKIAMWSRSCEMRDTGWILKLAHNEENAILINHIWQYDLGCFSDIFAIPTQQREQTSDLTFHEKKHGWTDDEYDRDVEPNLRICVLSPFPAMFFIRVSKTTENAENFLI